MLLKASLTLKDKQRKKKNKEEKKYHLFKINHFIIFNNNLLYFNK